MKCIICEKEADEVGSHIVPASLIKNCVGEHYKEESYNIDAQNAKIDVYFGRDNLKNTSVEIKANHYKKDYILCKICEKKLAVVEGKFASEFLGKFRDDKYKSNFIVSYTTSDIELYEPKKISNIEILVYFYSIIFRTCKVYEIEDNYTYLSVEELRKIQRFLNGYFYNDIENSKIEISEFNLSIIFNKKSNKSQYIATSDDIKQPYLFYFCEAIIQLFTEELNSDDSIFYNEFINNVSQELSKIIVGPENIYLDFSKKIEKILAHDYMTTAINQLCDLNDKPYEGNLAEVNELIMKYSQAGDKKAVIKTLEELTKKYSN